MTTALWIVKAEYLRGFDNPSKPNGDEPVTHATMLSITSSGSNSFDLHRHRPGPSEGQAIQEAMTLIARQAAWRGITDEPAMITTACANRDLAQS
jgi:hypothetical protein